LTGINFFLCCQRIFPLFAVKLGHFIINDFFTYYKHAKKSENEEKGKIVFSIGNWSPKGSENLC